MSRFFSSNDQSEKLPAVFLRYARGLARFDGIVALMPGSRKLFSCGLLHRQGTQRRPSGVCAGLHRGGARELGRKEHLLGKRIEQHPLGVEAVKSTGRPADLVRVISRVLHPWQETMPDATCLVPDRIELERDHRLHEIRRAI